MWNAVLTRWLQWLGGNPCFRIYGKARVEASWRVIDVYATDRRNAEGRLPLWRGTCTTWTDRVITVGWDFAETVLREQQAMPASRDSPVEVAGGRLRGADRGLARTRGAPSASEVLAHECGHTWQAQRLGPAYLPLVGSLTLFREGPHFWNHFENQASEQGQFGGIVGQSLSPALMSRWTPDRV
jgi:hypothetical protein